MSSEKIPFRSDVLIRLVDPEDFGVDPDDSERLLDSGTATYKVFDPGVDEVTTLAIAGGVDVIPVSNPGAFASAVRIEIEQDDGTFQNTTLVSLDVEAGTITVDNVTTSTVAAGSRVRGAFTTGDVAMALYGDPVVGDKFWGYQGQLEDDGDHQVIGQEIEAEMTLDAGAGLKIVKILCLQVVESCDL